MTAFAIAVLAAAVLFLTVWVAILTARVGR